MATCRVCGTLLIEGMNWISSRKRENKFICNHCWYVKIGKKATEKWKLKHPSYHRDWERTHRLKGTEAYEERRKQINEMKRRKRQKLIKELGGRCFFCEREENLIFHKKENIEHAYHLQWLAQYKDEFVLLCKKCHRHVHFCYEHLNLSWDDILLLKKGVSLPPAESGSS